MNVGSHQRYKVAVVWIFASSRNLYGGAFGGDHHEDTLIKKIPES
jgi:hypothetical protein